MYLKMEMKTSRLSVPSVTQMRATILVAPDSK